MHQVKSFEGILKLQNARLFFTENHREIMVLDFYPELREQAFGALEGGLGVASLNSFQKEQFAAKKTPLLLYLKAHFVGHLLHSVLVSETAREILFDFGDRLMKWDLAQKTCVLKLEGRKDYQQALPRWASLDELNLKDFDEKNSEQVLVAQSSSKKKKLLQNVESDLKKAQNWIVQNKMGIQFFLQNPALWGESVSSLPEWTKDFLAKLFELKGVVFKKEYRKTSLDRMKQLLQRQERKVQKAQERFLQVEKENQTKITQESFQKKKELQKQTKKQNKIGSIQKIANDLELVVGRKATENDELYRQAQSRDLWFHVRGQKGGHAWLRRGQKGFGAKDEASQVVLQDAALVAVKHSKVRGSWIPVDYTERRYLKKAKGAAEGELLVLKSKTIFVSFEK